MKTHGIKGLMTISAVVLVLGLATSALATRKLSFGVGVGMGFMTPLVKGGDLLPTEDWNDMVDDLNQTIEDTKDWVEETMGGTASINLAEKITRGWDIEGYAQYRITEMFGLRGSVGYLTGMKSGFGYDASYWHSSWGEMTDKIAAIISASCLFISLEPILSLPMGNFLLTFGGGPGYYMGQNSYTIRQELSGDRSGTLVDFTADSRLSGSKIGFRGFLEGEYSTGSLTIGAKFGYRSTGEIETTGEGRLTGEEWGVPIDETAKITGKLDFSGLYILFGIGFAV